MNIALVGCGFVADLYVRTLPNHPQLRLLGVMDRDAARAERFAAYYSLRRYPSLAALLADPEVELVVNLTNPASHYAVSKAALEAGKHVYSEKPLAMELVQAQELAALAERQGLLLASAPCSVLGEQAQTLWRALRAGAIGQPWLVYAELDDGPVHQLNYRKWRSESGSPWPVRDEFEVGCTLEHAGYYVTWLVAFFGPVRRVTAFATCLVPNKLPGLATERVAPDLSVACIEFQSGVVARLTCSIIGPHNHELRIIGEAGVLTVADCWYYEAPVYLERRTRLSLLFERFPKLRRVLGLGARRYPAVRKGAFKHRYPGRSHQMDFARGLAELADAVAEGRPCRLSTRMALHINELVLAIQHPSAVGVPYELTTTCDPMDPMPWAKP